MPLGLYGFQPSNQIPDRGAIVLVCLPLSIAAWASDRDYIGHGDCDDGSEPMLKTVVAIAQDTIAIEDSGIAVNGQKLPLTTPLAADSQGRPMPHMAIGTYVVPAGTVWVIANHDTRSLDSRYFGPLPTNSVIGTAHPIITF